MIVYFKNISFRLLCGAQTVKQTWSAKLSKSATLRESETYCRRRMDEN